jgi:general secretion pathway protein C
VKAIRLLEATLLALCCYLGGALVTTWPDAAPDRSVAAARANAIVPPHPAPVDRQVILDRNLFQVSTLMSAAPIAVEPAPETEVVVATRLPLRLLGTVATADVAPSLAAVEDQRNHKQLVVRAGDPLLDAATVLRIERRRIVIQNGDLREELALDDAEEQGREHARLVPGAATSEAAAAAMRARIQALSETTFAEEPVENALDDPRSLETRIAPRVEHGQVTGVELSAIERGSIFDTLGIREGDTVTQVNGVVATNQRDSIALLRELTEASDLQVNVVGTDGAVRTLVHSPGD